MLQILRDGPVPPQRSSAIDDADAVFVLGEDVLATAPRVALALRQAARGKALDMTREKKVPEWQAESTADIAQHERNPIFVATPAATGFDDIAKTTFASRPTRSQTSDSRLRMRSTPMRRPPSTPFECERSCRRHRGCAAHAQNVH